MGGHCLTWQRNKSLGYMCTESTYHRRLELRFMHQSFVVPTPTAPRNNGDFNFQFVKPCQIPCIAGTFVLGKIHAKSP